MCICEVDGWSTVGAIGVRGFSTSRMGKRLQRAGRRPFERDEKERKRLTYQLVVLCPGQNPRALQEPSVVRVPLKEWRMLCKDLSGGDVLAQRGWQLLVVDVEGADIRGETEGMWFVRTGTCAKMMLWSICVRWKKGQHEECRGKAEETQT